MVIENMRVEGLREPIGVSHDRPAFSFETDVLDGFFHVSLYEENEKEAAQEMVIDCLEHRAFRFPSPLRSGMQYRWEITNGKQRVKAQFETACDFFFHYITPERSTQTLPQLVRFFEVEREIHYARLLLATDAAVAIYLNDERVKTDHFRLDAAHFCTLDITHDLWRGIKNRLAIFLSDKSTCLAAGILLVSESGKRTVIGTDQSWRVRESGVLYCREDQSEEHCNLISKPSFRPCFAEGKSLCSQPNCPTQKSRCFVFPVDLTENSEHSLLLDFGRFLEGFVRLRIKLPTKKQVVFQFMREENEHPMGKNRFVFYGTGSVCLYEPLFLRLRFRYLLVEGLSVQDVQNIEAVHFYQKNRG